MDKAILPPGDSTVLEVIFNTTSYNGQVTKRPRITCEDIKPDQYVAIHTEVIVSPDSTQPLVISPYSLDLSPDSVQSPDSCIFTVHNVSDQQQQMSIAAGYFDLFDFSFPRSIPAKDSFQCALRLTPLGKSAYFVKSFTVQTASSDSARFTIPVIRALKPASPVPASPPGDCP